VGPLDSQLVIRVPKATIECLHHLPEDSGALVIVTRDPDVSRGRSRPVDVPEFDGELHAVGGDIGRAYVYVALPSGQDIAWIIAGTGTGQAGVSLPRFLEELLVSP
jgi:hypothetical protein